MARAPTSRAIVGRWFHVFEEDDEAGEVYRRDDADIPLTRRTRGQLEIRSDGSAVLLTAGPDDRLFEQPGVWTEKGGAVVLRLRGAVARQGDLRLTLRPRGKLVVQRGTKSTRSG
jgi:hypothetical protein